MRCRLLIALDLPCIHEITEVILGVCALDIDHLRYRLRWSKVDDIWFPSPPESKGSRDLVSEQSKELGSTHVCLMVKASRTRVKVSEGQSENRPMLTMEALNRP